MGIELPQGWVSSPETPVAGLKGWDWANVHEGERQRVESKLKDVPSDLIFMSSDLDMTSFPHDLPLPKLFEPQTQWTFMVVDNSVFWETDTLISWRKDTNLVIYISFCVWPL